MESKQLKWIYLIILSLIWGSSFILIKKGLLGLNPIQLGALRIIFSALFLFSIGAKSLSKIPHFQWKFIALTSVIGTFIPVFLFAIAQTKISSSISSILNSLTPLNTLVIGILGFGIGYRKRQLLGVIIGLIGTLLLILYGNGNSENQNYSFTFLVLIASICYAINVNLIKKFLSDLTPLSITTGNFAVIFIPALIILYFTDFFSIAHLSETQHSLFFVMILGVVGTGIANIIFFKLIQISSPIFATSVTYLIPVVAFAWGLVDNETITPMQLIGAMIILTGVYLSNRK